MSITLPRSIKFSQSIEQCHSITYCFIAVSRVSTIFKLHTLIIFIDHHIIIKVIISIIEEHQFLVTLSCQYMTFLFLICQAFSNYFIDFINILLPSSWRIQSHIGQIQRGCILQESHQSNPCEFSHTFQQYP